MIAILDKNWIVTVYFRDRDNTRLPGYNYFIEGSWHKVFESWYCKVHDLEPRHWDWDKYV